MAQHVYMYTSCIHGCIQEPGFQSPASHDPLPERHGPQKQQKQTTKKYLHKKALTNTQGLLWQRVSSCQITCFKFHFTALLDRTYICGRRNYSESRELHVRSSSVHELLSLFMDFVGPNLLILFKRS